MARRVSHTGKSRGKQKRHTVKTSASESESDEVEVAVEKAKASGTHNVNATIKAKVTTNPPRPSVVAGRVPGEKVGGVRCSQHKHRKPHQRDDSGSESTSDESQPGESGKKSDGHSEEEDEGDKGKKEGSGEAVENTIEVRAVRPVCT